MPERSNHICLHPDDTNTYNTHIQFRFTGLFLHGRYELGCISRAVLRKTFTDCWSKSKTFYRLDALPDAYLTVDTNKIGKATDAYKSVQQPRTLLHVQPNCEPSEIIPRLMIVHYTKQWSNPLKYRSDGLLCNILSLLSHMA